MSEKPDQRKKDRGWRGDEFASREVYAQFLNFWLPISCIVIFFTVIGFNNLSKARANARNQVVVYAAQDQVYAEPILREFEKETGIKIKAVYDSEAVKTVGLANRLFAERSHPQCDVFWGNEEMRTRQLAAQNVFRETNGWTAFGYRNRRIVINTNFVSLTNSGRAELPLGPNIGAVRRHRPTRFVVQVRANFAVRALHEPPHLEWADWD